MRDLDTWEISASSKKSENNKTAKNDFSIGAPARPAKRKGFGNVLISMLLILILAILVVLITLFVFRMLHPQEDTVAGYKPLRISTDSMEPTIMTGALVIARQVPFDSLEAGDIITFERGDGMLNTHRVLSVSNGSAITQGDNVDWPDVGAVSAYNFRYKIVLVMNWTAALNTPKGIIIAAAVVLAVILLIVALAALISRGAREKTAVKSAVNLFDEDW